MAIHQAGTPVSFMADVHCAAATQNSWHANTITLMFLVGDLVKTTDGRQLITKGFATYHLMHQDWELSLMMKW